MVTIALSGTFFCLISDLMAVRWATRESIETLGFLKTARSSAAFASILGADERKFGDVIDKT